ncbi:MarR family transcriptional regulator [Phenylobacterium sp. LjRoot219]|uniref:MarR family winged helix-turn-helix transcriptional regulator n=1 Tax=Phenylobacterium sp. LjRoot219 TaxID=3342283 RepID=UPI003ECF0F0A
MPDRTENERLFTAGLLRLTRIYRREIDKALAAHGLSDARALPVLHIARLGEGVRQGVLAEELGVEGPSLVRILDQLCAAGLVERRDDPNDRRAKTLHLSDEGRALAAVVETSVDSFRRSLMGEISDADLSATLRTLARFDTALEAAQKRPRSADS